MIFEELHSAFYLQLSILFKSFLTITTVVIQSSLEDIENDKYNNKMVKKEDGSFHKLICVIFIHPAMLDCFGVIKS